MPALLEKYEEEVKQYGSLSAIKDEPVSDIHSAIDSYYT